MKMPSGFHPLAPSVALFIAFELISRNVGGQRSYTSSGSLQEAVGNSSAAKLRRGKLTDEIRGVTSLPHPRRS